MNLRSEDAKGLVCAFYLLFWMIVIMFVVTMYYLAKMGHAPWQLLQ